MSERLRDLLQIVSDLERHRADGPDADGVECNRCGRGTILGFRIEHADGCDWLRAVAIVEALIEESAWTPERPVPDGRVPHRDSRGRTLMQRPDGEWTIHSDGMPVRLELGTHDLDEAKRRAGWTSAEWAAWRRQRTTE
jgi:hypothetical protein